MLMIFPMGSWLVRALEDKPNSDQATLAAETLLYDESLYLIKNEEEMRKKVKEDIQAVFIEAPHENFVP